MGTSDISADPDLTLNILRRNLQTRGKMKGSPNREVLRRHIKVGRVQETELSVFLKDRPRTISRVKI